ncbi:MAG: protoglobin domain-containing protein [Chloroflexi bacterium]|nr:protoglobin domain-containing protein [Chloroflexota bacterium]
MSRLVDWPARMREVAAFVGLDQDELDIIQSTRELVLARGDEFTATVYDHFLKFPETRRFFLNEEGEVNEDRLERRKHSLMRWLRGSIDFKIDEDYPIRVLATGIVHSHPPLHRAHMGSIPSRFMLGTMSFMQTALSSLLAEELDDPQAARKASVAWNKLLMVQLDILLAGYIDETPTAATEETPAMPDTGPDGE